MNSDRAITKRIVQHAEERGVKGLFITVDAPQLGRREKVCSFCLSLDSIYTYKDMKMKFEDQDPSVVASSGSDGVDRSQGAARAISVREPFRC